MRLRAILASLALALTSLGAQAETIRVAIGTQDTTINCAAGGLLIRELACWRNTCRATAATRMRTTGWSGRTSPVAHR